MNKEVQPTRFKDLWIAKRKEQEILDAHREQVVKIVFDDLNENIKELSKDPEFVFPKKTGAWIFSGVEHAAPTVRSSCGRVFVTFGDDELYFEIGSDYDPKEAYYSYSGDIKHTNWHDYLTFELNKFKVKLADRMVDFKQNFGKKCEL